MVHSQVVIFICIHLFVAGLNKHKNKSSVHDRQQVIEEKRKTGVEPLNHFCILERRKKKKGGGKKMKKSTLYVFKQQFLVEAPANNLQEVWCLSSDRGSV